MSKASKGISGLFLALFILISGLCVGDDAFDILDFMPTITGSKVITRKAVATPFYLVPGLSNPVTVTVYIPDANLVPESVQLNQIGDTGNTLIGNLVDTGNQVFSITNNFQGYNGGVAKFNISAIIGVRNKTIATLDLPMLNIPTLQDTAQYNQAIDNIFNTLVGTKDNFTALQDPATPVVQFSNQLSIATDRLLSVYANMEAIYRAETHSPSNFSKWYDYIPVFGGFLKRIRETQEEFDYLRNNLNDPQSYPPDPRYVAGITAYAKSLGYDDYFNLPKDQKQEIIDEYQIGGHSPKFQKTLEAAKTVAVKEVTAQYPQPADLAGGWVTDYFGGVKGEILGTATTAVIDKIIDIVTSQDSNKMALIAAKVQNGEAMQVPVGSHSVINSFENNQPRAITNNITVNQDTPTTVTVAPAGVQYANLNNGLLAYYPFNGNTNDLSGNNNNAWLYWGGSFVTDRFGNPNNALYFSGAQMGIPEMLPPDIASFTFSAWVTGKSAIDEHTIWWNGERSKLWIGLRGGKLVFNVCLYDNPNCSSCGTWYSVQDTIPLISDQYIHLVCRYIRGDRIEIWINNQLKDLVPIPFKYLDYCAGCGFWQTTIGSQGSVVETTKYWDGIIDDIRIYNRALSDTEIWQLYTSR
jgi:hypothetical protein